MSSIKELALALQKKIDIKIGEFCQLHDKVKALTDEIESVEKKMASIVYELEPVESLINAQNPKLEKVFESLKKVYGKDTDEHSKNGK